MHSDLQNWEYLYHFPALFSTWHSQIFVWGRSCIHNHSDLENWDIFITFLLWWWSSLSQACWTDPKGSFPEESPAKSKFHQISFKNIDDICLALFTQNKILRRFKRLLGSSWMESENSFNSSDFGRAVYKQNPLYRQLISNDSLVGTKWRP